MLALSSSLAQQHLLYSVFYIKDAQLWSSQAKPSERRERERERKTYLRAQPVEIDFHAIDGNSGHHEVRRLLCGRKHSITSGLVFTLVDQTRLKTRKNRRV